MRTQRNLLLFILAFSVLVALPAARADETSIFTNIAPDAVVMIDLSGSMGWNPAGGTDVWGDSICAGPFAASSSASTPMNCSRLNIAKRSMFSMFDDNADSKVNCFDGSSMNVRMGLMLFRNVETVTTYYNGVSVPIGKPYQVIYCNASTACGTGSFQYCNINGGGYSPGGFASEFAGGSTPLNFAMANMKAYLDTHKAADAAKNCRQKFVILISDGSDTMSCAGPGAETESDMYKRRRLSVLRAKQMADAGYRIFVVGFGQNMPAYLKNTLNWMAYYGGTDNPLEANLGDTSAYDPTLNAECEAAPSTQKLLGGACDTVTKTTDCYANANDPGNTPLSGYAFISGNSTELVAALRQATALIREANYSFTTASVASARTQDENFIYEASFQPINADAFWLGHLRKFNIKTDGTIGSIVWDAGTVLQSTPAANRAIKTLKGGVLTPFDTTNILMADLGVATDTERTDIIGFVRGETATNKENWKLGDIFRSATVTVGSPSSYYADSRDTSHNPSPGGPNAYAKFRNDNPRTTANGYRVILAGANDGQLHAFRADTGVEVWSFVPPNLRFKLKNIAHKAHPTGLMHQYFVDGPISVADIWTGSGDGTSKAPGDWKTLLVFGEGRGSTSYLWSSSATCDSDFDNNYSVTRPYYCGYWAFNVTSTYSPSYQWKITPTAAQAPYLGDPWSKMYIGRMLINGNEKWVGFIGGGHNLSNLTICTANGEGYGDCDKRGKGLFAIDLANGNVLWSITHLTEGSMEYAFPAPPALLDSDRDGFIDRAYIGDLGGNMWRLKFCTPSDGSTCNTANWAVNRLFNGSGSSSSARPIYNIAAIAKDGAANLWVYWGTGDKVNSTDKTQQDLFVAMKDTDSVSTRTIDNLQDVSAPGAVYNNPAKYGWYIQMPVATGEKILAEPTVFGGAVWFTSWVPPTGADACGQAGVSNLYGLDFGNGSDGIDNGSGSKVRSISLGAGMATAPTFSLNPYGGSDLYITQSGGGGTGADTTRRPAPGGAGGANRILYWRDMRLSQ